MSNRNLAAAAPQILGVLLSTPRSPATSIVEFLRSGLRRFAAWRNRLYEFLASDHRPRRISDIDINDREGKRCAMPGNDKLWLTSKTASAGRPIF